ncbi:hypothetical protein R6Q57_023660 [Mikania cordata]
MTDYWLQSALTNDVFVAELLLRVKHSSDSISDLDSLRAPPPTATTTSITAILPPRWGHRRYRSKSTASTTAGGKEHRGSPTTHLSWSGGSISDGFDESSRPSDLLSGGRSVKVNEGPSTSSYNKFEKRKSFVEHKDEESSLYIEKTRKNMETSMQIALIQPTATSENLKRTKIELDHNQKNKTWVMAMGEHERKMKFPSVVTQSCRVEAETEGLQRGFVLPDLNMIPDEGDLAMMMT